MNELPDILIKAPKLFLYLKEGPRVRDGSVGFEPVSYDLGVYQKTGYVTLRVSGYFSGVKIVKGFSVAFPLFQNGRPAQPCLRALQNKKLKETPVIVNRNAPFMI
jgi:hypothetical protein